MKTAPSFGFGELELGFLCSCPKHEFKRNRRDVSVNMNFPPLPLPCSSTGERRSFVPSRPGSSVLRFYCKAGYSRSCIILAPAPPSVHLLPALAPSPWLLLSELKLNATKSIAKASPTLVSGQQAQWEAQGAWCQPLSMCPGQQTKEPHPNSTEHPTQWGHTVGLLF